MRTVRVQFEDTESPESVARRVSAAFPLGSNLRVRDKFYRVIGPRNIYLTNQELVGDNYTEVLSFNDRRETHSEIPPPPKVNPPALELPQGPSNAPIQVGQRWKPKDARRKGVFTIVRLDGEFAYADDGRKVALNRMNRYRLA
jgi:hypothetical protein